MWVRVQGSITLHDCLWAYSTKKGAVHGHAGGKKPMPELGKYATRERADEVVSEIRTLIKSDYTGVYEMPEE